MRFSKSLLFLIMCVTVSSAQEKEQKMSLLLMGDRFEFTTVSDDKNLGKRAIDSAILEIKRIDSLISEWIPSSETSLINDNAGIKPVKVSDELFNLIERSIKVSEITSGAFDITFASVNNIYQFDRQEHALPAPDTIRSLVKKVGYERIFLSREARTVMLAEQGMKIGFGGIGQGYAANKAKEMMREMGIKSGVVNASGDIVAWGKREDGSDWEVGIGDPKNPEKYIAWLKAAETAIVTSGNYEKFFTTKGIRYGHIIDPRTGYPSTGLKSVTIICPEVELADALATGVFVLGEKEGMELIEQLRGIECVLVNDKDEIKTSSGVQLNYYSGK